MGQGGGDEEVNINAASTYEYIYAPVGPNTYHFSIYSYDMNDVSSELYTSVSVITQ